MSRLGERVKHREDCRYCGTPFGAGAHNNQQFCSKTCRDKEVAERRAAVAREQKGNEEETHAGRTHGAFYVPGVERGQSNALNESFFCWLCHKEYGPKEVVKTLGLKCECGAMYIFTVGTRDGVSHIVRVDRIA